MYRAYFHQPESFFYEQDAEFILHYLQTEFPKAGIPSTDRDALRTAML